jgi:Domain of unknown function (DUF4112)
LAPEDLSEDEAAALAAELARLERLAYWLDARFTIPLTRIRIGLDPLIGLIPGIGDVAAMVPAAYLLWRARQLGLPRHALARMAGNVALDAAMGAVPLVGDVFDVAFKANRRNVALLRRHLTERQKTAARHH